MLLDLRGSCGQDDTHILYFTISCIYISPRGEQHLFRSVEQVGNDLMSAGFHREASDIFFGLSGYLGLPLGKDSGDRKF